MDEQNKKDEIEEIFSYYGRQRDKNSQEMIVALLRELQEVYRVSDSGFKMQSA